MVIRGVIPIGLQASERKRVWETKNVHGETVNVGDARKRTIQRWQKKWLSLRRVVDGVQRFSHILPVGGRGNLKRFTIIWHNCYLVISVSTRLRCGRWYDQIATMVTLIVDAEHTFFYCERWRLERRNLGAKVGACTIENFCDIIQSSEENGNSIACYIESLLKSEKFDLNEKSKRRSETF